MPDPAQLNGPFSWRAAAGTVIAAGARPCSGAILVLVFAMAQGLFAAGVAAAFAMAIGTAVTTGALAWVAVFAKSTAMRLAAGENSRLALVARGFEFAAALAVLAFGLALLARRARRGLTGDERTAGRRQKSRPEGRPFFASDRCAQAAMAPASAPCDSRRNRGPRSRGSSSPRSTAPARSPSHIRPQHGIPVGSREVGDRRRRSAPVVGRGNAPTPLLEQIDDRAVPMVNIDPVNIQESAGPVESGRGRRTHPRAEEIVVGYEAAALCRQTVATAK